MGLFHLSLIPAGPGDVAIGTALSTIKNQDRYVGPQEEA
jgi:hypothetical protein